VDGHPLVLAWWVRTSTAAGREIDVVAKSTPQIVVGTDGHLVARVRPPGLHGVERLDDRTFGFDLHPWVAGEVVETAAARIRRTRPTPDGAWIGDVLDQLARLTAGSALAAAVGLIERDGTPLRSVAAALGWSERTLRRRFVTELGIGPDRLRQLARVGRAREALHRPGASIAATAIDVGYCDQAHLTRDFARFCGYSPAEWRDRRANWRIERSAGGPPVDGFPTS
jgi:AraC-like DNA-binding protein